MPALLVLDLGEAAALDGPGQDHGRLVRRCRCGLGQGVVDRRRGRGRRSRSARQPNASTRRRVGVEVPAELGRAALAEPVDVDDGGQVGQLVVRRLVERLPDRALGHLAVAAQHPHVVRQLVEVLAGQGDADGVGQALAERAGGHVDPGQDGRRVALQAAAEAAVAVSSSSSQTTPAALKIEYSSGEAWPLEKIRWSLVGMVRAGPSRSAGAGPAARPSGRRRTCWRSGGRSRPRCWTGWSRPAAGGQLAAVSRSMSVAGVGTRHLPVVWRGTRG